MKMVFAPEMKTLTLFRGLAVSENDADCVIEEIKLKGLDQSEKQTWKGFDWRNLKNQIEYLYSKPDLTLDDTSDETVLAKVEKSLCFADKVGAKYYAAKHNATESKTIPLLVTVDLDIENTAIDGRDFLYTVFQSVTPKNLEKTKRQTEKLKRIFGNKIERYINKIIEHPKSNKWAICDLVINDDEIIIEHSKSEEIIKGRHKVIFKSAFFGKTPIPPEKIRSVEVIKNYTFNEVPTITLDDVLES